MVALAGGELPAVAFLWVHFKGCSHSSTSSSLSSRSSPVIEVVECANTPPPLLPEWLLGQTTSVSYVTVRAHAEPSLFVVLHCLLSCQK